MTRNAKGHQIGISNWLELGNSMGWKTAKKCIRKLSSKANCSFWLSFRKSGWLSTGSRFVIYEIRSQAETFCTRKSIRKSLEMPALRFRCNLSVEIKFMTSGETLKLNLYLSLHWRTFYARYLQQQWLDVKERSYDSIYLFCLIGKVEKWHKVFHSWKSYAVYFPEFYDQLNRNW